MAGVGVKVRGLPGRKGAPVSAQEGTMPKMRKKSELPQKTCAACGLPFTWRKKWERDWETVRFCSDRCRKAGANRDRDPALR